MNNTKKRLVASLLAMAMCFTMLVGSTFAWFTDNASTSVNRIQAGNLEIELLRGIYSETDYMDDPISYEELTEESLIPEDILWEPGYLWYDNLIVRNVGNLHAKFKAFLVPTSEVGELANVIDVYVSTLHAFVGTYNGFGDVRSYINGEFKGTGSPWDAFDALNPPKKIGTLAEVIKNQTLLFDDDHEEIGLAANGGENMICIALKMQETAGNEYKNKVAGSFDIVISATQDTFEKDSYDNQYDKDAEYDLPVTTKDDLVAALGSDSKETVKLGSDIVLDEITNIKGRKAINLNGNTLTVTEDRALDIENGTVTLSNGTIEYAGDDTPILVKGGSELVIDNTVINVTNTVTGNSYGDVLGIYVYGGEGSVVTMNSGEINVKGSNGGSGVFLNYTGGGNHTFNFNGGTINVETGKMGIGIECLSKNTLNLNGGTINMKDASEGYAFNVGQSQGQPTVVTGGGTTVNLYNANNFVYEADDAAQFAGINLIVNNK